MGGTLLARGAEWLGMGIAEIGNSRGAHSGGHGDRVLDMLGRMSDIQMNTHAVPSGPERSRDG